MAPIAWHYCLLECTGENCVKNPSRLQANCTFQRAPAAQLVSMGETERIHKFQTVMRQGNTFPWARFRLRYTIRCNVCLTIMVSYGKCFPLFKPQTCKTITYVHDVTENVTSTLNMKIQSLKELPVIQLYPQIRHTLKGIPLYLHVNGFNYKQISRSLPALRTEPFVIFVNWLYIAINLRERFNSWV